MTESTRHPAGPNTGEPLGVAVVGYSFMGKAHSNAWRNVGRVLPRRPRGRPPGAGRSRPRRRCRSGAPVRLGRVRDRLAVRPRAATTSTWSTSARRATCTPRSRSPPWRPASTCWSRSPSPTTLPRPSRWSGRPPRHASRGVHSMVGFNYRRVPALALARRLVAEGRIGTVRQARVSYLQDWLTDDDGADDLATAARDGRIGRDRRPGVARGRPARLPARPGGHLGQRHPPHLRRRAPRGEGA